MDDAAALLSVSKKRLITTEFAGKSKERDSKVGDFFRERVLLLPNFIPAVCNDANKSGSLC